MPLICTKKCGRSSACSARLGRGAEKQGGDLLSSCAFMKSGSGLQPDPGSGGGGGGGGGGRFEH